MSGQSQSFFYTRTTKMLRKCPVSDGYLELCKVIDFQGGNSKRWGGGGGVQPR